MSCNAEGRSNGLAGRFIPWSGYTSMSRNGEILPLAATVTATGVCFGDAVTGVSVTVSRQFASHSWLLVSLVASYSVSGLDRIS